MAKAKQDSEAGALSSEQPNAAGAVSHAERRKADVLVDAASPWLSLKGWRINRPAQRHAVIDGPFAETKELITG
jgi:hypothetical protein